MKVDTHTTMKLVSAQMRDIKEMASMIERGLDDTRAYRWLKETVAERQKILDMLKEIHDMPEDMTHPYKWDGEGEY